LICFKEKNMEIQISGRVEATPSAMTVLFNGTEIFSGQVGAGQPLDICMVLATHEWNSTTYGETAAVTISVTSGIVTIGSVGYSYEGQPTTDCRVSSTILINGSEPEWPPEGTQPRMPDGTPENPDWDYWEFEIGAGETITFNIQDEWSEIAPT
jgi:hypothetical protein